MDNWTLCIGQSGHKIEIMDKNLLKNETMDNLDESFWKNRSS